jgi:plasmid stabilization system protein ParE
VSSRLVFRPEAVDEIEQATELYESRAAGLGAEFLRALDAASVLRSPDQFPPLDQRLRRVLLRRFPYSLIYSTAAEEIVVLACVHWRQHPRRWINRR